MDNEKHYTEMDLFLKRSKKEFDAKWKAPLKCNASFEDFTILKTLGAGTFGRVVLCKHKSKGGQKNYAMKLMEKSNIVKMKQVPHTVSEVRVLYAAKQQFLICLEYFFTNFVYLCIVMPLINGGELFTHLRNANKFDETLTKFYTAQVVLAFEYLHYNGVIYRDLKPENIMLESDGYIRITDMGFCKKVDDTRTYTLCGTPEYLAPEIILSRGYNKSVDWWSLGVLIYEMAAGYPPFFGKDPMKTYEKIILGKFAVPSHFSKALKDLVGNILQVDRSKRFGVLKNGTKDIKGHDWFKNIDFDAIFNKKFKPSYKPQLSGEGDTSNFEYFEDEPLRNGSQDECATEFAMFV